MGKNFKVKIEGKPASYQGTMQSEVHWYTLQILDISCMQCPKLACHQVQEDICDVGDVKYHNQGEGFKKWKRKS